MMRSPLVFAAIGTALMMAAIGYFALACYAASLVQDAYGTAWSLAAFAGLMAAEIFAVLYLRVRFG